VGEGRGCEVEGEEYGGLIVTALLVWRCRWVMLRTLFLLLLSALSDGVRLRLVVSY
jgi:hypothetical protein